MEPQIHSNGQTPSLSVEVREFSFHGFHGVPDAEREIGVQLLADIKLDIYPAEVLVSDRVEDSVDYVELARLLKSVSDSRSFHTLEALGQAFADAVFERWPLASRLSVNLRKPAPPVDLNVGSVGVRLSVVGPREQERQKLQMRKSVEDAFERMKKRRKGDSDS